MELVRGRPPGARTLASAHLSSGTAWRDSLLNTRGGDGGVEISTICFAPGTYIRWHSHKNGQILVVHHGRGIIANAAGDIRRMDAGDVVYADPDEEHWHGSIPDSYLVQLNISLGATTWLEPVEHDRYLAACDAPEA